MVELDQIWFVFQHSLPCSPHTSSIGIAALGFQWYRSSHPDPQKSPKLQIWPHCRTDAAFKPCVFSCWGTEIFRISDGAKSGEYGGWSTSSKLQSHTAAIATTDLCAGALSWWKQDSLCQFFKMSLVLLFKVPSYLSSVGLSGGKQCS